MPAPVNTELIEIEIRADLIDFYIDVYLYAGHKNKQIISVTFLTLQLQFEVITLKRSRLPRKIIFNKKSIKFITCVESQAFFWIFIADAAAIEKLKRELSALDDAGRKTSAAVTADGLF